MYLHHILSPKEDELIKKFYKAQKSQPSKNDWVKTVQDDFKNLSVDLSEEDISKMKKNKFKKIVK